MEKKKETKKDAPKQTPVEDIAIKLLEPQEVEFSVDPIKVVDEPKKNAWELKDRTYILTKGISRPVTSISSKHTADKPLLWFDPELGYQRELRYATNQQSVFADEQKAPVTLAHIIFRDGVLNVPKAQQNLQRLLSLYHPSLGHIYEELNTERVAVDELEEMDIEFEALELARDLDIDELEAILRVEQGSRVSSLTSKEIKRDVYQFARRNPRLFLQLANDENVMLRNFGIKSVEAGFIALSQDNRYFIWKSTNRKLFTVPFDENPYSALASWFKTDEGVEIYNNLQKRLN